MKYYSLFIFLIFIFNLSATIINIPADQPTVQEGINVAVDGDTVLVHPGTYVENINYNGKNIMVASLFLITQNTVYIYQTKIDSNQDGSVVTFENGEDSTAILTGFTITNGLADYGGGIYCSSSSAIVENNRINFNTASVFIWLDTSKGGGIYISGGSPFVKDNLIHNNIAINEDYEGNTMGGGIYISGSEALIKNNLITENSVILYESFGAGGGIKNQSYLSDTLHCTIEFNTIANNLGSGLSSLNATIMNNTIYGNSNSGISYYPQSNNGIIYNNNVYGNEPDFNNCPLGIGDTSWGFNYNGTACDSCFNISEDPLFISDSYNEYFLSQLEAGQNEQSPCVNAGSGVPINYGLENYTTRTDLICDEGIVDMGFHYLGFIPQETDDEYITKPFKYQLSNYPNPFNPTTTISFNLTAEITDDTELSIYNIKGQKIRQFSILNNQSSIVWDGKDSNDKQVSSGIYFYKLKAGDFQQTKKMMLIK